MASVYQLKITLLGIAPPIWRRIQAPGTILLSSLHDVLQAAFEWTDSHLHQFVKDGKAWGVPEMDDIDEIGWIDERETRLSKVLKAEGDSMIYVYDLGDNWRHEVVLEKIIPATSLVKATVCLGGERRRPPEDVGGTTGYQEFLEVIFDPGNEQYERFVEWAGGPFHAEEFDLKAVNQVLPRRRGPIRRRR